MIVFFYLLSLVGLTIYSYSQIDLNLTLLQTSWFLGFQKSMISLGYFNRALSTQIFLTLLAILTIFYIFLLRTGDKLSTKNTLFLLGGISLMGLISYPAFSHDIFNYIFDARIAVFHHSNPYQMTALMFPSDTWTRFMQWTHRTYPYGPTFLPISILFYVLGLNKFIFTLLSFKLMAVLSYLGSCYVINKISGKRGLIFFAFNPLVLLEAVNSSHLDIVMLFWALLSVFFLIKKRPVPSYISLLISIGIKYVTALFVPIFIFWKRIPENRRFEFLAVASYIGTLALIVDKELLPHYFLVPIGFVSLIPQKKVWVWSTMAISVLLLIVRYYPFLSSGSWLTISLFNH